MAMAMEEFLRKRNIPETVIDEMSHEKIDCETISVMSDDDLKRFIPLYGDRVAIVTFAKSQLRAESHSENSQQQLHNSVIGRKRKCPYGNKNAARSLRRVELGWMNYNPETQAFKQVRTKNGGGTRQLLIEKALNVCDICELAKTTFFPNRISKFGPIADFSCEIRDFKGDQLSVVKTVEDIYSDTKLKLLRLYLYTKKNPDSNTDTTKPEDSDSSSDELVAFHYTRTSNVTATSLPVPTITTATSQQVNTATSLPVVTTSTAANLHEPNISTAASLQVSFPITGTGPSIEPEQPSCSRVVDGIDSGTPEVTFHPRHRLSLRNARQSSSNLRTTMRMRTEVNDVIEVIDTEDEEIQQAIQESLLYMRPEIENLSSAGHTLEDLLKELQGKTVNLDLNPTKIIVFRSNLLESALRALDRKSINLNARLYVKFSGEIGEDFGGPRREFFRLALNSLHESMFFEGPETQKVFTHDISLLETNQYRIIGRLVALSLVQEGPAPHFLNGCMFDMMVGVDTDLSCAELMLPDDLAELIRKLEDVDTDEKRDKFLLEHGDELIERGFGNPYRMTVEKKSEIIHMLKKYYIYYRISNEITQFKAGMNEVGHTWDFIQKHVGHFKPLFCQPHNTLTADVIGALFNIQYSEPGSNDRQLEDVTVYGWELFIQSVEEQEVCVTFPELLAFATGADHIPPCGFVKPIDIVFYNTESDESTRLPSVSTCSLQMWLPRLRKSESLSSLLIRAVKESGGFLKI